MKAISLLIAAFSAVLVLSARSYAEPEAQYDTRHAVVIYSCDDDFCALEKKLKGGISMLASAGGPASSGLADRIDNIYEKVTRILGMDPGGKRISIEVIRSRGKAREACRGYRACYVPSMKRVIVSVEDINSGMFAHELAHAIMDASGFPLPESSQEILAQYVDVHLDDL